MSAATERANMEQALRDPRVAAFLAYVIRPPESGYGPAGYGLFYGDRSPSIFDFSRHPGMRVVNGANHSAAGAYQFVIGTWNYLAPMIGVSDFSPRSQDLMAVELLARLGALPYILQNNIAGAIDRANGTNGWASLPGGSQSRGRTLASALAEYNRAIGGAAAPAASPQTVFPDLPANTFSFPALDSGTWLLLGVGFVVLLVVRNWWE